MDAHDPSIADNANSYEYLIVWEGDDYVGSLVDEEFEIYGQLWKECPLNYTGLNQITGSTNSSFDYETDGILSSSQIIISPISGEPVISYDSGIEINLLSEFEVQLGALFRAYIDGCAENP